jgi:hypothetical protein
MNSRCIGLAIAVYSLNTFTVNAADLLGYIATTTNNSVVYRTNFTTGTQTPLGPSGQAIRAIAENPADGSLYAHSGPGNLYRINTTNGAASFVAAWRADDMAFFGGHIYAISEIGSESRLSRFNLSTGTITDIGPLPLYPTVRAFAIDASGQGIGWDEGSDFLFRVNLSDATTTTLGLLPGDYQAMDYGPDGTLYGWQVDELYRVNPDTVSASFVRGFAIDGVSMTLDRLVPEPHCFILVINVAGFWHWRGARDRRATRTIAER